MSDHSDFPTLPQPVPTVTAGGTRTGSEVIDCRIVRSGGSGLPAPAAAPAVAATLSTPVRGADGVWEITVPDHATPLTDLVDPAVDPRILDDGWLTAGALLARRLSELVAVHPVRAKRHLVQVAVPADTTRRSLRALVTGLCFGGHVLDVAGARRTGRHPVLQAVHVDISATTLGEGEVRKAVRTGTVLGAATACARDIGAVPASAATPAWWRRTAKAVLGDLPGTRAKLHGAGWLQRKGFTGLLSAAAGEAADRETALGEGEAALLELVWDPDAAGGELTGTRPDTVLVGGATVPAAIRALAELGASRKVVGLV
ncbi:MAG: aminopeptidase, partial [Corynebacterium nuruki]|nr:aminopeptidase [Corynebacterium nuruki]